MFAIDKTPVIEDKAAKLELVRGHIKEVETEIKIARNEIERLQQELRANEIAAGEITLKLIKIKIESGKKKIKLNQLNKTKIEHEKKLAIERDKLAKQIRAAYMTGKGDYIKLLLNQEDPALVGRMLAYYDYHNRARTMQINTIKGGIRKINQLEEKIKFENEILRQLKSEQLRKREEIIASRESRNLILINLENHIIEQGLQLQSLQQEEKEVAALLEKLGKAGDTVIFFEDIPSFNSQKGKLKWPIKGTIMNRFGTKRKGGALKWQGVRIRAEQGSEVRAISTGKVIFADWFRNMGLLMILDHGEGYMSLYGYNQSLLKKSGDWVVEDEVIAYAGDSGGQSTPSVYFEIRHRGEPLNPILWCKK